MRSEKVARAMASVAGRPYYGPRVEFTIWNVTPGQHHWPVGSYTGWTKVPGSVERARRTAHLRMSELRAEWTWQGDRFEIRQEYRL